MTALAARALIAIIQRAWRNQIPDWQLRSVAATTFALLATAAATRHPTTATMAAAAGTLLFATSSTIAVAILAGPWRRRRIRNRRTIRRHLYVAHQLPPCCPWPRHTPRR